MIISLYNLTKKSSYKFHTEVYLFVTVTVYTMVMFAYTPFYFGAPFCFYFGNKNYYFSVVKVYFSI